MNRNHPNCEKQKKPACLGGVHIYKKPLQNIKHARMSLWPRYTKVTLCTALAPGEATRPKHGKKNGIDDLQHFQEPNVWVNSLSWPQDSRSVMFVEGIQWASLEIWGHCATMSPDWNQSQRLWRVFGNCLQYPSKGSLILSPAVLLISMQIISLVWVTGWK